MAFRLAVGLDCSTAEWARQVVTQLDSDTRPIFDEDVPAGEEALFAVVEELEFPHRIRQQDNKVWVLWVDEESISFEHLKPLLELEGITLIAAHEIPDYTMSGDEEGEEEGWYWVPRTLLGRLGGAGVKRLAPNKARSRLGADIWNALESLE